MLIVSTPTIQGQEITETLGIVQGSTVQAKHMGKDIGAAFKQLIGGELKAYTEMLEDARKIATEKMLQEAKTMNADAIVNVRYTTSNLMQGASEILVYGTAVKLY